MRTGNCKGTFTLEYGVLIAILVIALIAMSIYMQRAICGKMKASGDVFGGGRQYQY